MTDDKNSAHVYGAPDPDNREPAPANGLRGEGAATPTLPDDGGDASIVEVSGTSAVETRGGRGPRHAALVDGSTDDGNADQTRDAGPANMRDRPKVWDPVDQSSDESFPASDPPGSGPRTRSRD